MDKPFSPAAERNREPILAVLRRHLADRQAVLEIGSGTGQHAVYFAKALPQLRWQSSEVAAKLPGLRLWLDEAGLPNTPAPLELDVNHGLPQTQFDAVFTANTLHIMAWAEVERLFTALAGTLRPGGQLIVYGPFNYEGRFTSQSNADFDASLRRSDPRQGIRDFEAVDALALAAGLRLLEDQPMPANNRCLTWRRAN